MRKKNVSAVFVPTVFKQFAKTPYRIHRIAKSVVCSQPVQEFVSSIVLTPWSNCLCDLNHRF
jgi:hypothetical protein